MSQIPPGRLLDGAFLTEAENWISGRRDSLSIEERNYVVASVARHKSEQDRTNHRRHALVAVVSVFSLVALLFALVRRRALAGAADQRRKVPPDTRTGKNEQSGSFGWYVENRRHRSSGTMGNTPACPAGDCLIWKPWRWRRLSSGVNAKGTSRN